MAKSYKLEDGNYIDSGSIVHNKTKLSEVLGEVIYDNESGARSGTFSKSIANYKYIEIYDTSYKAHKYYTGNSSTKTLPLTHQLYYTNGDKLRTFYSTCTITNASFVLSQGFFFDNDGYVQSNETETVKLVIGYK